MKLFLLLCWLSNVANLLAAFNLQSSVRHRICTACKFHPQGRGTLYRPRVHLPFARNQNIVASLNGDILDQQRFTRQNDSKDSAAPNAVSVLQRNASDLPVLTTIESFREKYGSAKSVWGDWSPRQTRRFYKNHLPRALLGNSSR